jgi:hypothetical protein
MAGASSVTLFFLPETFGPVLLARHAQALSKSTGNDLIFACIELEKKGFKQMATVTLTRPLRMLCSSHCFCHPQIPGTRLCNILYVFRGLPHYLPTNIQNVS